ncbi:hypothetical protein H1230_09340 [Paenibacillus sp. 19GGS1-52]|uniref:hypothetical protein n=1 Tax=Paenibacillus sp. 19GGS1-52 TaxID=2758563 RepID=UPI001EFBDB3B|nr:hypothetical protein [Paenibacillus sp. 19GGS1-52]ULO08949.1 hypothetical protein H1230_09340 [Paenibacillus sp. 19GGS1-52]
MKRITILAFSLFCFIVLSACSDNKTAIKDSDPAQAKVENSVNAATETAAPTAVPTEAPKEDIWTYYDNATWTDNFNGLVSTVEKVVVSDRAPQKDDENDLTASAVGIKMKVENTTKKLFTAYPDQAVLVTSTGEQIEMPETFLSDDLGGEIDEGVIKEGNIIWYLKRGHAEDITWIKLKWSTVEGDGMEMDAARKEYAVKIPLK